ncbi:HTH_Tnp_Tc3_2 domain-containing protein [Trichonephila clavipes]|nr:HTH_Tnp_Tc3_2 domain-containing protein [Trichonephila clavipes]
MTKEDHHLLIDYSEMQQRGYNFSALSSVVCSHRNPCIKGDCFKRLHERRLFARIPAVCVPIISMDRKVHLAWCRQHRDLSMDQWATVLFTDESCFSLNTNYLDTVHMERARDPRYLLSNIHKIDNYGRGGLMT